MSLTQAQMNAIKWCADRRNGNAALVVPETLQSLIEGGYVEYRNLVKSDPVDQPNGIDPAMAKVPMLSEIGWAASGYSRRDGSLRIVFRSPCSGDDTRRMEVEIAPRAPGVVVMTLDASVPRTAGSPHLDWKIESFDDLWSAAEVLVARVVEAAMKSGWRGEVVDDQQVFWNDHKISIVRGADAGTAVRAIFTAMGWSQYHLPDEFPGRCAVPGARSPDMVAGF